ncbi:MAG: 6-bladed beta-propeller [Balneola sp.]
MNQINIYIISILLLFGCKEVKQTQPSSEFEKYIIGLDEVKVSKTNIDIDREQVRSLLSRIDNRITERIFLIDYSDWSIFTARRDGVLLDKKGGQGKGPGEFLGINDLHTYAEEKVLQVFDKKMKRLTYYNIHADSLELRNTVQLPNYDYYYLQNVFKGNNGKTIGIFRVLRQYGGKNSENKIYAYYLDEEFKMKEKMLEFEGTELIETKGLDGGKRFRENLFGNETNWSFYKNKLYYSNAKNLSFSVFDFKTEKVTEYKIQDIPENVNTDETTELMISRYKAIIDINPEYEDYFKDRKTLPYFSSIVASNDFLYFPLTTYGREKGYILRFNLQTKQMERIETQPNFFMKGVNQAGIFGTTAEQDYYGETSVWILEFE